jgi:uncharacterized membrane protein
MKTGIGEPPSMRAIVALATCFCVLGVAGGVSGQPLTPSAPPPLTPSAPPPFTPSAPPPFTPSAKADIVFCNEFAHTVFVAIAYQQANGHWLSRGWLEVATGDCGVFDTAIRVKTFYFRGMTDPYLNAKRQQVVDSWGKGREFAVWEKDNFQYYSAETRVLNSTLQPFTQGPETDGDAVSATVTFPADGSGTIVTTK